MSVVVHVKLLNILGSEKVLDKYFEIKGVLNLITSSMVFLGGGVELLSRFFNFSIQ